MTHPRLTPEVDDRQYPAGHQCRADRVEHGARILEVVIGIRCEHQGHAPGRELGALLLAEHREHIAEARLRRASRDRGDEALGDIHREHPSARTDRLGKQHRVEPRAGPHVRDPHAGSDLQRIQDLETPIVDLSPVAFEDVAPAVMVGPVIVSVHVRADGGGLGMGGELAE